MVKKIFILGILWGSLIGTLIMTYGIDQPKPKIEIKKELVQVIKEVKVEVPGPCKKENIEENVSIIRPQQLPERQAPCREALVTSQFKAPSKAPFKNPAFLQPEDESLLPPPEFDKIVPPVLKTIPEHEVTVSWEPVDKANRYFIFIKDFKNRIIKKIKTADTSVQINNLPQDRDARITTYKISLATMNKKGSLGHEGPPRKLFILGAKNILPPSIEKIIIEE